MSRVDRITIEEINSGVCRVGPIVGPEVSPFDGVRDVAADIPTTSWALLGGGGGGGLAVCAPNSGFGPAG